MKVRRPGIPALALAAVLTFFLLEACVSPLPSGQTRKERQDRLSLTGRTTQQATASRTKPAARSAGSARRAFAWTDVNTRRVVEWRGDTAVVDPSVSPQRYQMSLDIDLDRLHGEIDAFGVPQKWMKLTFRNEAELRQKEEEFRRRIQTRGFRHNPAEDTIGPDPGWMVARGREDLRGAAAGLLRLGRDRGVAAGLPLTGLLASFVQGLKYQSQPTTRQGADGQTILVNGVSMPLETLYHGAGDCDSRCVLLATLMAHQAGAELVLLEGMDHMFAAVRGQPRPGDQMITLGGVAYILVELTDKWPLGRIPGASWRGLGLKKFRVVRPGAGTGT